MIVGIPTYGRSWTLASQAHTCKAAASGPGLAGSVTKEAGVLSYTEICQNITSNGWSMVGDSTGTMGPYAHCGTQWVGYDDPSMAAVKAGYILNNKLGGAMFWDLPSDDFRNKFGAGKYPIIRQVFLHFTKFLVPICNILRTVSNIFKDGNKNLQASKNVLPPLSIDSVNKDEVSTAVSSLQSSSPSSVLRDKTTGQQRCTTPMAGKSQNLCKGHHH